MASVARGAYSGKLWLWPRPFGSALEITTEEHGERWRGVPQSAKLEGWRISMYRECWCPKGEIFYQFEIVMQTDPENVQQLPELDREGVSTIVLCPFELLLNGFLIGSFSQQDLASQAMFKTRSNMISGLYVPPITGDEIDDLVKALRKLK